ncbi:uncharacterized protein BX663DRAFT_495421 [Cokeromyces recurvatus]|uniref:uncharacterized protein n=1 Tax=Cokeromyces recurvatus TaxID=90255 RepID=UPI002220CB65|nr:uncharacterized protein BX663DRAFT_495421 [Cokeromyces recurvatus]KAI7907287.1 hypothetical protein BX663DRAFT_495421 [Cokeromyces recurvatus]
MPAEWIYANGSSWVSFDPTCQTMIESLWTRGGLSNWINCQSFEGPIFIDTTDMIILYNSFMYTIVRRFY